MRIIPINNVPCIADHYNPTVHAATDLSRGSIFIPQIRCLLQFVSECEYKRILLKSIPICQKDKINPHLPKGHIYQIPMGNYSTKLHKRSFIPHCLF